MNFLIFVFVLKTYSISIEEQDNLNRKIQSGNFTYAKDHTISWFGQCSIGLRQSPINIIDGINTVEDNTTQFIFNYTANQDLINQNNKITYNGQQTLTLNAPLGQLYMENQELKYQETYEAEKIVFHYPAEHYVTLNGLTVRYPLEMQIFHNFKSSSDAEIENPNIKRAIVSIFFDENSEIILGNTFMQQLGVEPEVDKIEQHLELNLGESISKVPGENGLQEVGLNAKAVEELLSILNYDSHIYRYFGSLTVPPCSEEVLWIIFQQPRSISQDQMKFFRNQSIRLRENVSGRENVNKELSPFYGNNRRINPWDIQINGKIQSMQNGIKQIVDIFDYEIDEKQQ